MPHEKTTYIIEFKNGKMITWNRDHQRDEIMRVRLPAQLRGPLYFRIKALCCAEKKSLGRPRGFFRPKRGRPLRDHSRSAVHRRLSDLLHLLWDTILEHDIMPLAAFHKHVACVRWRRCVDQDDAGNFETTGLVGRNEMGEL